MVKKSVLLLGLFWATAAGAACPDGYTSAGGDSIDDCYMEIQPGYYWTGSAVEICPAEHACAGGNMPYADRGDAWGIASCDGKTPTAYLGMSHCGCPIDPLDGKRGIYNDRHKWCFKPVFSDSGTYTGVKEYTTVDANCYWNGKSYAVGGTNNYGCDAYHVTACAAGYYAPIKSFAFITSQKINCSPVETGYYSPEGDTEQTPCTNAPENTRYIGGGTANDCPWECDDGYGLHDGACVPLCAAGMRHLKTSNGLRFNLYPVAYSAPAIHVKRDSTVCYGVLAPGAAANAININHNGQIYHAVN